MKGRAGVTRKVSLSVHKDDLALIRERAKRLHDGNVSAVFAELIDAIKRQEAWDKAVAWYGKPIVLSEAEREKIDRELLGERAPRLSRKRKSE